MTVSASRRTRGSSCTHLGGERGLEACREETCLAIREAHDIGEGADCHRVSNHPNQHQDYAEDLLDWVLARDISVAHCRDRRDNEIQIREVLLWIAGLFVSDHPWGGREVLELGDQEHTCTESVAQYPEDEEEKHHSLEFNALH